MRRQVQDVMTRTVAVVTVDTPFKVVARRLAEHRVAALPVVDARDRAVGIVSEVDLLVKEEHIDRRRRDPDRARAAGTTAGEIMSTPVVTIGPEAPLADAARLMHVHGFRSMPVVDADGRVIGIVARRDLLRAFLRDDEDIREEIVEEVVRDAMWLDPDTVRVTVEQGVVTLEGEMERASLIPVLVRMASGVDGVVRVDSRLGFDFDDTGLRPVAAAPWGVVPYGTR